MLPKTSLSQLIPARLAEALRRVERAVWRPGPDLAVAVSMSRSHPEFMPLDAALRAELQPVPADDFHWGPKYAQRWFRLEFSAPLPAGCYLEWRDQGEATAYLDGIPYCGFDVGHPRCRLPDGIRELWIESVCIRSAIWLDGNAPPLDPAGSRYEPPRWWQREDQAWEAYHDLKVLLDLLDAERPEAARGKPLADPVRFTPGFARATPLFRRLLHGLDAAVDRFDLEGLPGLRAALRDLYTTFPADPGTLRAQLTGHAHIDLVWLWPERVGTAKVMHTWSTQLRLLERYPEFRFGFSQPAAYAAVGRVAPGLLEQVRAQIAAGRWEATGAAYVESDNQLPCGEALLRSFRLGQDEFIKLRGTPARVLWMPDVFGYSGCLPQLMRAVGVSGFFTTKVSWSSITRFPHTSFVWRGADGSEVAAHVSQIRDYCEAVNLERLREDGLCHQQAAVHPEVLVPTGYSDGGGGPTEEMCERARRAADLAGVPRCEWGGIEAFFDRLGALRGQLPLHHGELYLEMHRGVLTTGSELKAAFRALERAVQTHEAAHAATGLGPIDDAAWRRLIFAQFHDYIPGSSIWEVYAAGIPELRSLATTALAAARHALESAGGADACLFNPLPCARLWPVEGRVLRVPPLCGIAISTASAWTGPRPQADSHRLTNGRVSVTFGPGARLESVEVDGHPLGLVSHELICHPDHPACFEAWDVDRAALSLGQPAAVTGEARVIPPGPDLSAAVEWDLEVPGNGTGVLRFRLRPGAAWLDIEYELPLTQPNTWLRAYFKTTCRGTQARYGAPFGSTLRPQVPQGPAAEAQWEVPASRWGVVMDDAQSEGVFVATEAKYGMCARDGELSVSLLRSALVTEADHHPACRELPDRPRHFDLGVHRIALAVGRFAPHLPTEELPAAVAETAFTPCLRYVGKATPRVLENLKVTGGAVASWAEPLAGGAIAMRLHETLGRRATIELQCADDVAAHPGDAWGQASGPASSHHALQPYEFRTLRLTRASTSGDPLAGFPRRAPV